MIHLSQSVRLAEKDVGAEYKKTPEIIPKTSSGVWCLVLGMPQGGGDAVEGHAEESNEGDLPWVVWCLKGNGKIWAG